MTRKHLTPLTMLLVASVGAMAGAQTPATPTPVADSVAPDSVAPKKAGRFGGLMNKAKAVAGNKTVQAAAKGAATNVACNAVPGVAVAAAVSGGGPCQNTLMGGLVSKGVAGTAAAVASGAASGAAAKAVGKMGGTTGSAATGALGAVGGQGGLTNAATAALMSGAGAKSLKKGSTATPVMPAGADMAAAMAAMGAAMGAAGTATAGANKVETVDFRELKALLPESLRGMRRTDATGQKSGAMGIQMSSAEGQYSAADGNSLTLTIVDIGSVTGLAAAATYAWVSTEIDREGDSGYEKTTMFKGFKALEKYKKQGRSGELSVLVEGRFVVGAQGSNVDMDTIKAAVGSVDLRKLAGMKSKGVK